MKIGTPNPRRFMKNLFTVPADEAQIWFGATKIGHCDRTVYSAMHITQTVGGDTRTVGLVPADMGCVLRTNAAEHPDNKERIYIVLNHSDSGGFQPLPLCHRGWCRPHRIRKNLPGSAQKA